MKPHGQPTCKSGKPLPKAPPGLPGDGTEKTEKKEIR